MVTVTSLETHRGHFATADAHQPKGYIPIGSTQYFNSFLILTLYFDSARSGPPRFVF
jgi:hypothetical protein